MSDELEVRAAMQELMQPLHSEVSNLAKAVSALVTPLQKAEEERLAKAEALAAEEKEKKMLKRLVNALKEMGVQFKGDVASQTGASPKTKPEQQQETIQGQAPDEDEEDEAARGRAADVNNAAPEDEKEKEEDEMAKLKLENANLSKELNELKESMPEAVSKGVEDFLNKKGWKAIGHAPVTSSVNDQLGMEQVLLKSEGPVNREELITSLKKMPLAQLNDMRTQYLAGTLAMPEVN